MIPFEFVVLGTPVSVQAHNKKRLSTWKAKVKASAMSEWPVGDPPDSTELQAIIVFYFDEVMLDTDNIIKPILDALCGAIYIDDNQITDVHTSKRDLNGSFTVRGLSPMLARGFSNGTDFVYVRIETAPNPQELI